jgi:hypothetical protein
MSKSLDGVIINCFHGVTATGGEGPGDSVAPARLTTFVRVRREGDTDYQAPSQAQPTKTNRRCDFSPVGDQTWLTIAREGPGDPFAEGGRKARQKTLGLNRFAARTAAPL